MPLWVHTYCAYASYDGVHGWGQAEYDAYKLVQLLKGKPVNGYVTLKRPDGVWTKMTSAAPAGAFEIWGQWAAAKAREVEPGGAYIVHVPASDCLAIGTDTKGRRLAAEVEAKDAGCSRWTHCTGTSSFRRPLMVAREIPLCCCPI